MMFLFEALKEKRRNWTGTGLVIKEGITIGGKTVNEHLEVLNHKKGIEYLQGIVKRKSDLSEEIIKEMHRIILSSIDEGEAGHYLSRKWPPNCTTGSL